MADTGVSGDARGGYSCSFCDHCCFDSISLLKHYRGVHENDPNFIIYCNVCGKSFRKWNSLKKHLHRSHRNELQEHENGTETNEAESSLHDWLGDSQLEDISNSSGLAGDQWDSALFLLRVTEEHSITHGGVESLCDSTQWLVERVCLGIHHCLQNKLKALPNIDAASQQDLLDACKPDHLFDGLTSRYLRESYYEKEFNYVKPTPVTMGSKWEWTTCTQSGARKLQLLKQYGYYIDLFSSIKALLMNPAVRKEISQCHASDDGRMRDFCDGEMIKSHPYFASHPNALQLILYYDDIEVANPLGAKAGNHKLGVFYYILGNIRPAYRSSLQVIQLLAVAKSADIKMYGCDPLLMPFIQQANELAKGQLFSLGDEDCIIHGQVLCVLGDTPALNVLGGFKEGVGFSLRKCRMCLATGPETQTKFHSGEFTERTKESHEVFLALIESSGGRSSSSSTTYGINYASVLQHIEGFDITKCLPYDVMHTIFEGVVVRHLNQLFHHLIDTKHYLSLADLNHSISMHPYGYSEADTKPSPILRESTATSDFHFHQSASQMMTLVRLLPFMIGEMIEENDEHWSCFLLLWDICNQVCSFQVTQDDCTMLAWLVQIYLETWCTLYPEVNLTPKMHYLVHLPRQMQMFGPLRQQWCFRFESKNAQIKSYVTKSFRNVPLTVAIHHQQQMCYSLVTRRDESSRFLYVGDEVLSGSQVAMNEYRKEIAQLCGEPTLPDPLIVLRTKGVKIHGVQYRPGAAVRVRNTDQSDQSPQAFFYGTILEVIVYKDEKIFILELMDIVKTIQHIGAFEVKRCGQITLCFYTSLYCHGVIHIKERNGCLYLVERDGWAKGLWCC